MSRTTITAGQRHALRHGQETINRFTPLESAHPYAALAILRKMAGEREADPHPSDCSGEELEALKMRMYCLVIAIGAKMLHDHSLELFKAFLPQPAS